MAPKTIRTPQPNKQYEMLFLREESQPVTQLDESTIEDVLEDYECFYCKLGLAQNIRVQTGRRQRSMIGVKINYFEGIAYWRFTCTEEVHFEQSTTLYGWIFTSTSKTGPMVGKRIFVRDCAGPKPDGPRFKFVRLTCIGMQYPRLHLKAVSLVSGEAIWSGSHPPEFMIASVVHLVRQLLLSQKIMRKVDKIALFVNGDETAPLSETLWHNSIGSIFNCTDIVTLYNNRLNQEAQAAGVYLVMPGQQVEVFSSQSSNGASQSNNDDSQMVDSSQEAREARDID